MTHTPGPWRAETWESGHTRIRAGVENTFVADINNHLVGQTGPNARLIAAAPDMLDALYTVKFTLESVKPSTTVAELEDLWSTVSAVINKAEGR